VLLAALAPLPVVDARTDGDPLPEARSLVEAERYEEAARVLRAWLQANPGRIEVHDLHAQALAALERRDEAADQLARAMWLLEEDGRWDSPEYVALRRRLHRADPLARKRDSLFDKTVSSLSEVAEKMLDEGHEERALDLLGRLLPIAPGDRRAELEALRERARAAFEEVRLDDAGSSETRPGQHPLVEHESLFYRIEGNLEREVIELVAATMDDVFRYYVQVYFDGDLDRAKKRKATIRIHPTHEAMMEHWGDPGRSVGGWWSSAEWKVVCYDTRTTSGSLDPMLETLFHEASHQFMTMLSSRGGSSPSWLNEGTACFFEGATAMADRRVLWPDAAPGRLFSLAAMLRGGSGPTPRQVIAYSGAGSYEGEYYPYGWGLVYYLQQYEDPTTLEYVWRPYYRRYLETITKRGGSPMELFEEVFLAKDNPGGFEDFDAFARSWQRWILDEVFPLHSGRDRREHRLDALAGYLRAADRAAGDRRAPVSEEEFLLRGLRQVEYVRTEIDDPGKPDGELVLVQADVLERLGRKGTAAAMIELALELAEREQLDLEPEAREALAERMARLDRRNAPLRQLRLRSANLLRRARSLAEEYDRREEPMLLRSFDFARTAGAFFEDAEELLDRAARLRELAVAAGLVPSRIVRVEGETWETIFTSVETYFTAEPGRVSLGIPARVAGRICVDLPLEGEYEVRGHLVRLGEIYRSSFHGIVVVGAPERDWYAVGIGSKGRLVVKRADLDATGAPTVKTIESVELEPPLALEEELRLAVHVGEGGLLTVRFPENPARAPLSFILPEAPSTPSHVGILVKDAELRIEDLVVEILP